MADLAAGVRRDGYALKISTGRPMKGRMEAGELVCLYAAGQRNFVGADLRGKSLYRAALAGVCLSKANLRRTRLATANLEFARLCETCLVDADMTGANLRKADLTGACLVDADLTGADLTGACLVDAALIGADLTGAIGFRPDGAPDPRDLRRLVADRLQTDGVNWDTYPLNGPADMICRLAGIHSKRPVLDATRLLWLDGAPGFNPDDSSARLLAKLRRGHDPTHR